LTELGILRQTKFQQIESSNFWRYVDIPFCSAISKKLVHKT
jgi:hypothetical protein